MSDAQKIHSAELAGYSSIVGQPIMLLDAKGACIGQLSLIGVQDGYREMVANVADALNAPNRHAYKVGIAVGKADQADTIEAMKAKSERLRAALDALISVAAGYQNMPGFSLHPMLSEQIKHARAARAALAGEGEG